MIASENGSPLRIGRNVFQVNDLVEKSPPVRMNLE